MLLLSNVVEVFSKGVIVLWVFLFAVVVLILDLHVVLLLGFGVEYFASAERPFRIIGPFP